MVSRLRWSGRLFDLNLKAQTILKIGFQFKHSCFKLQAGMSEPRQNIELSQCNARDRGLSAFTEGGLAVRRVSRRVQGSCGGPRNRNEVAETRFTRVKTLLGLITLLLSSSVALHATDAPQILPTSRVMLSGAWLPADSHQLDFDSLPRVPSEHAVINDVHATKGVNQHNYLVHYDGQFWAMWSDGPGIEDRVGQRVKFATSADGLKWNEPRCLTPIPPNSGPDSPFYGSRSDKGMRWIARGFWPRNGELLALAALDEAAGFFGPDLELHAFRWNKNAAAWTDAGVVCKNAINNFPPLKLRTGDWMMSRRPFDYKKTGVQFLVGGTKALDQWESYPVLGTASELSAEEPDWWILPDQQLAAVFRDNRRSGFLYRSLSTDNGHTWTKPVRTNFPDATSKISGLRLGDGRYVLISNPNPKKRDPLTLSISSDGLIFSKMLYLVGGRHVDYPHVIEYEGCLLIAFAGDKQSVEVLKVKLHDADAVTMPQKVLISSAQAKP